MMHKVGEQWPDVGQQIVVYRFGAAEYQLYETGAELLGATHWSPINNEPMYETISYKGKTYPKFQSEGFASQFAFAFAHKIIGTGKVGYDIGCNNEAWKFPLALPIDPTMNEYDAYNLPKMKVDYIFSSHCLEHLDDWVKALDIWREALHDGGVLFLYLPHPIQQYWLPWNNRKHRSILHPADIEQYLNDRGWKDIIVTGHDLNFSYYAIARK